MQYDPGGGMNAESAAYLDTVTLPEIITLIGKRAVVIVYMPNPQATDTATIIQECLTESGVTCGAITSLPATWWPSADSVAVLERTYLSDGVDRQELLVAVVSRDALVAFCGNNVAGDTFFNPGFGEVAGRDLYIPGHRE